MVTFMAICPLPSCEIRLKSEMKASGRHRLFLVYQIFATKQYGLIWGKLQSLVGGQLSQATASSCPSYDSISLRRFT